MHTLPNHSGIFSGTGDWNMTSDKPDVVAEDIEAIIGSIDDWGTLSGRTVLLTGAGGFIGNYLVRTLLALNARDVLDNPISVIAVVRSLETARKRFLDFAADPYFRLECCDLAVAELPDLEGIDYIIHAASQASPRYYGDDPVGTILPNILGTAGLLRHGGVSLKGFMFISSSEVYGCAGEDGSPLKEENPGVVDATNPRSCYAESKRAGEALCVAWYGQYGVPTYIVRPFHTYGPGLARDDGRVFADFIYNAVDGENIVMRSDGEARRAFCYVSDFVTGAFTVLLRGEPAQAYNVGNPDGELSIYDLAKLVGSVGGEPHLRVIFQDRLPGSAYIKSSYDRLVPNIDRISALGWQPLVKPSVGFRRAIDAIRNN